MKKIINQFLKLNLRSIFLNFYLLPFRQAVHLPLLFSRNTRILEIHRGGGQLNSDFIKSAMVQIGYKGAGIIDGKYERTIVEVSKNGHLVFNGRCFIGSASKLCVHGNLEFGFDVSVTGRSDFICYKNIKIGAKSLISWDCLFMDTDFHKIYSNSRIINEPKDVSVGEDCWIGCRSTILKGSNISKGSVVGAGSTVSGNFEKENSVYAGNPAKLIKGHIMWRK